MKYLVLIAALACVSSRGFGWDTKSVRKYSEEPGARSVTARGLVGLNSDYGIVGAELGIQLTPHLDLHGGIGVGPAVRKGGGFRLMTADSECFMTKFCLTQYYMGFTATHGSQTSIELKQDDGTKSNLRIPEATYLNVNVGTFDYFFRHLHAGLAVGYQTVLNQKGKIETVQPGKGTRKRTNLEQQKKMNKP